ncbi:hypothetical protein SDC9_187202 [bioreactor metagenome]|uniref:Uncharacterized protein n=1 Tax=bioreactor metagenome TaxID=1076179 RepID=A0A645HU43_9ZZZZ
MPVGSDVSLQACVELVNPCGFHLGKVAAFDFRLTHVGIEASTHSHVLCLPCHAGQKNRLGKTEEAQRIVHAYHPIGLGTQLSLGEVHRDRGTAIKDVCCIEQHAVPPAEAGLARCQAEGGEAGTQKGLSNEIVDGGSSNGGSSQGDLSPYIS